jgi:hypothetical protein
MIILPTIIIVTFLLSRPVEFCQCILLDVHIPLDSGGCVRDYALLANRLLRGASSLSSGSNEDGGNEEMVHLDTIHVPHVTLYLADFDLEVNDEAEEVEELADEQHQTSRRSPTHHREDDDWNSHTAPTTAKQRPLNQTKVDMFLRTISSINFNDIITRSTRMSSFSHLLHGYTSVVINIIINIVITRRLALLYNKWKLYHAPDQQNILSINVVQYTAYEIKAVHTSSGTSPGLGGQFTRTGT